MEGRKKISPIQVYDDMKFFHGPVEQGKNGGKVAAVTKIRPAFDSREKKDLTEENCETFVGGKQTGKFGFGGNPFYRKNGRDVIFLTACTREQQGREPCVEQLFLKRSLAKGLSPPDEHGKAPCEKVSQSLGLKIGQTYVPPADQARGQGVFQPEPAAMLRKFPALLWCEMDSCHDHFESSSTNAVQEIGFLSVGLCFYESHGWSQNHAGDMRMNQAPVTRFLVFLNVGIHILRIIWYQFDPLSWRSVEMQFGIVPIYFWEGAVWQPFTAMFLHSSVFFHLHLTVNMLSLWSLGQAVERTVGSFRFLLLYFVSGLMSSLFVVVFQHDLPDPTFGASGALFGLLGAIGIFYPRSTLLIFFLPMRALTAVFVFGLLSVAFIVYDHLTGSASVLSHFGHLGGLVGGVVYSKFALQLPFLDNRLHVDERGGYGPFRKRGQGQVLDDELREAMRNLKEERERGHDAAEDRPVEPFNTVIREEPPEKGGEGGRRIYFDPATGRFYIR